MNITNDERRVIILTRIRELKARLEWAVRDYEQWVGNDSVAREKLRLKLAEIGDGLGKACD